MRRATEKDQKYRTRRLHKDIDFKGEKLYWLNQGVSGNFLRTVKSSHHSFLFGKHQKLKPGSKERGHKPLMYAIIL